MYLFIDYYSQQSLSPALFLRYLSSSRRFLHRYCRLRFYFASIIHLFLFPSIVVFIVPPFPQLQYCIDIVAVQAVHPCTQPLHRCNGHWLSTISLSGDIYTTNTASRVQRQILYFLLLLLYCSFCILALSFALC